MEDVARLISENYRIISTSPFIVEYPLGPLRIRVLIAVVDNPEQIIDYAEKIVTSGQADHALIVAKRKDRIVYTQPHVTVVSLDELAPSRKRDIIEGLVLLEKPVKCFEPVCNEKPSKGTVLDFLLPVYLASFSTILRRYVSSEIISGQIAFEAITGAPLHHTSSGLVVLSALRNITYNEALILDMLQRPASLKTLHVKSLIPDVEKIVNMLVKKRLVKRVGKNLFRATVPGPRALSKHSLWRHLKVVVYNPERTYTIQHVVAEKSVVEFLRRVFGASIDASVELVYYPLFVVVNDDSSIMVFDRVRCRWSQQLSKLLTRGTRV